MIKLQNQVLFFQSMKIDTLIQARWIIPVEPDGLILENHALAITAGKIHDILPQQRASEKYQPATVEHLAQHALIPGFVNAHTHAAMALLRGIADDLPLMEWLHRHIWPLEQRWVSEAFVRDGIELAMAEMLRGGITCFNDMYFFPEVTAREASRHGMRACVGLILIDFASPWAENGEEYLAKGLALHDELRHDPLVTTLFAPHAPYSVSEPLLRRMRILADELELPIHMHLHETPGEIAQSLQDFGARPFERMRALGIADPAFIAVHMTQLSDEEIIQLAESGCHIVHCPQSNLKLASGFCPVAKLSEAGVNVALGTDSAASNNALDMLGEMKTAALLAKGIAGDPRAVPAPAALRMATLNGAKALGLNDRIGSLERGKAADIAAIRLDAPETQPLYDPIAQIVYAAQRDQVSDVWVTGRRLLKARQLTSFDLEALGERVACWQKKLYRSDHQQT